MSGECVDHSALVYTGRHKTGSRQYTHTHTHIEKEQNEQHTNIHTNQWFQKLNG